MSENNNQIAGALTFPRRNEENAEPLPEQPRQPTNLQGLLRFAMEATLAEDAPAQSNFSPMDDERQRFLENALRGLTVDMTEVLLEAIKLLSDNEIISSIKFGETIPENVSRAFDNLLELVDDIDVANDFYKIGGFTIFPVCLGSENNSIRALASTVLAEACQNNPFCQAKAYECGLFNILMNLLQEESGEALVKELYALSCACREFEPACRELVTEDGCTTLARILTAQESAARIKAAFLIHHLCQSYSDAKEIFVELNVVKTIAEHLKAGRDSTSEYLISIVSVMLKNRDAAVLQQCTEVNLKNILKKHLTHPDLQDDRFLEEKEYCQIVIDVLRRYPKVERLVPMPMPLPVTVTVIEEVDR